MRSFAALVMIMVLVFPGIVNAKDISKTRSMRALKMENFDAGQIGTIEIQNEVGKINLIENELISGSSTNIKGEVPVPTAEDTKKGYITFIRSYLYDTYPFTNPLKEEIAKKEIKIFASLGEYEPILFSVYPLVDLLSCKTTVLEFVNEKGDKLPKDAFQINHLAFRPVGPGTHENDMVLVKGECLERKAELPKIEKEITKTIWINVLVPETAKAGDYKGKVSFKPANKPETEIPVTIKVLPVKLVQPPAEVMTWGPICAGSRDLEELEKEFIASKEHGCHGHVGECFGPEKDNDYTKANKAMAIAKKVGMQGKFVMFNWHCQGGSSFEGTYGPYGLRGKDLFTEKTFERLTSDLQALKDNADKNKWLPFVVYLTTELGSTDQTSKADFEKTLKLSEGFYSAARKVKGLELMATFNRQAQFIKHWNLPAIDVTGFNGSMFKEWAEANKEKPSWMTFMYTMNWRCGYGLYMWKYNFKGCRPWTMHPGVMYAREPGLLYYYNKEQHPSPNMERIREAVDDYKYMYFLSELVKQAKAKGKDTKSAELTMKKIIDQIPENHNVPVKDVKFDYNKLDDFRWQLAEQILKLMN